jgi:succinate dehydrogenase flavin-adding protein (antitoxin of CptAB toxin-antitoxin module)
MKALNEARLEAQSKYGMREMDTSELGYLANVLQPMSRNSSLRNFMDRTLTTDQSQIIITNQMRNTNL